MRNKTYTLEYISAMLARVKTIHQHFTVAIVFTEQTAGLIDRYEARGVLKRIDAAGSRDVTVAAVLADLVSASGDDS